MSPTHGGCDNAAAGVNLAKLEATERAKLEPSGYKRRSEGSRRLFETAVRASLPACQTFLAMSGGGWMAPRANSSLIAAYSTTVATRRAIPSTVEWRGGPGHSQWTPTTRAVEMDLWTSVRPRYWPQIHLDPRGGAAGVMPADRRLTNESGGAPLSRASLGTTARIQRSGRANCMY